MPKSKPETEDFHPIQLGCAVVKYVASDENGDFVTMQHCPIEKANLWHLGFKCEDGTLEEHAKFLRWAADRCDELAAREVKL